MKKYAKNNKIDKSDEEIGNNEIKILKIRETSIYNKYGGFLFKNSNNHSKHLCMVIDKMGCDLHILKRLFKYTDGDSEASESDGSSIVRCLPHCLSKK